MIKVSDCVKEIIESSETALNAINLGILNYSAYAEKIHKEVEAMAKKEVQFGTIVVALSRLASSYKKQHTILPKIVIDNLSIKAPLIEFTLIKNKRNLELLRQLYDEDFLTITSGVSEITIIASEAQRETISKAFNKKDVIAIISNLVALSVKFNQAYVYEPNLIYAILRTLALKRINIIEIISTYTELTFIVEEKDMEKAFVRLNQVYQK